MLLYLLQNLNRLVGPYCEYLGQVFQSIVSLTTSLKLQFVKYMRTTQSNTLLFFVGKNVRIFYNAKDSHIFSTKITAYL